MWGGRCQSIALTIAFGVPRRESHGARIPKGADAGVLGARGHICLESAGAVELGVSGTKAGNPGPRMPIPLRELGQEPSEALTPEEGAGVPEI